MSQKLRVGRAFRSMVKQSSNDEIVNYKLWQLAKVVGVQTGMIGICAAVACARGHGVFHFGFRLFTRCMLQDFSFIFNLS